MTAVRTPEDDLATIGAFTTRLARRPDCERVCALLANAFVEHVDALWPQGEPAATHDWIAGHVFEILAACERLYGEALCEPMAMEFLDRMAWLPELLKSLDKPMPLDA
jgi:hypothetical protein